MDNDNISTIEEALLIGSTILAYHIRSLDGHECWIPKSQVSYCRFGKDLADDKNPGQMAKEIEEMDIPRWLAEKNNLI